MSGLKKGLTILMMRIIGNSICDDWLEDEMATIASFVNDNYSSNTKEKALFKAIYDSAEMTEFREKFEVIVKAILELDKVMRNARSVKDAYNDQIREMYPDATNEDVYEITAAIADEFWGCYTDLWPIIGD